MTTLSAENRLVRNRISEILFCRGACVTYYYYLILLGINGCKYFVVLVNLFQCAFVPAGSICVGNFELPRRKGRGRGGSFSETDSGWVTFVRSGVVSQSGALNAGCNTINLGFST